jgi:arylamine N-acetyltransferase
MAEKYCWAIKFGGAVILLPIRLQCGGVWISMWTPKHIRTFHHMNTQFRLAPDLRKSQYCVSQGTPVQISVEVCPKRTTTHQNTVSMGLGRSDFTHGITCSYKTWRGLKKTLKVNVQKVAVMGGKCCEARVLRIPLEVLWKAINS